MSCCFANGGGMRNRRIPGILSSRVHGAPEGANRSDVWRGLVYAENSGAPDVYGKEEEQ